MTDETPYRFEPAFLDGDAIARPLVDLVDAIRYEAAKLPGRLPTAAALELAELVRIMNCYYSNLIEGHKTRPVDIERALLDHGDGSFHKTPLLMEAEAHVMVQRHIDLIHARHELPRPTTVAFIKEIHRLFYEAMPPEFREVEKNGSKIEIRPGVFRATIGEDVAVGRHIPPSSPNVATFMDAYESRFAMAETGANRILAIPAAHHRLNYVHPFIDGNGRVSRLMSHAMAARAGIGGNGLWSISRGLARGLRDRTEYKSWMDQADMPRQSSTDGRGNLSERALVMFSKWFMEVALDQIRFCARAFELDTLEGRYRRTLGNLFKDERHGKLVCEVLKIGELERGRAQLIVGGSERTARTILSQCVDAGFLKSETPKAPVRVGFPISHREWLFPGLFAEDPSPAPRQTSIDD